MLLLLEQRVENNYFKTFKRKKSFMCIYGI